MLRYDSQDAVRGIEKLDVAEISGSRVDE